MATSSITKKFVINNDAVCKKLVDELEAPQQKKQVQKAGPSSYEKGKKLLPMCYRH